MKSLKNIPSIDEVINEPRVQDLACLYNRDFILERSREATATLRKDVKNLSLDLSRPQALERIIGMLQDYCAAYQGNLQRVINGTGVILHTNLGRAPLGERALNQAMIIGQNYSNLELDLSTGERGSRYQHVEEVLTKLTGAEAALVVNNNAAAVLLALTTLAQDREVIVSRGQLIEIGGAFRIPDVMRLSGARLVEVGTTNRTYRTDYEAAINDNTALLFSAHTSNYKIMGFVHEVSLSELVDLGRQFHIPTLYDLGSGILVNTKAAGLADETNVQDCVKAGVDIVCFSGDKLLGGPQAGILVGKAKYIEFMKKNQLLRALRVDKLTLAALEGTLLEYRIGKPEDNIPVIRMILSSEEELAQRARRLRRRLIKKLNSESKVTKIKVSPVRDTIGGGTFPTYELPGYGIELSFSGISVEGVAQKLRQGRPPLLVRKQYNQAVISLRTIFDDEFDTIAGLLQQALAGDEGEQK